MRIGIQTWGSRGDIMPLLALAEGLQGAGHDVTIVLTSIDRTDYKTIAQQKALKVRYVGSPVIESDAELARINAAIFAVSAPLKQARMVLEDLFVPVADMMLGEAQRLCRENDLVIGHFFHYPLRIAAELTSRPYVSVMLVHSAIPSAHIPPSGLPSMGRLGNRFWWWLARRMLNRNLKPIVDRMRIANDLAPARDLIDDVWTSPKLNLIAVTRALCTRQHDWGDQHQVCGAFEAPETAFGERTLERDLEAFLIAGPAPVYVSFGSVMPVDRDAQKETVALLIKAGRKAACRMVIQAPLWRDCGFAPNETVLFVGNAPHAQVFPRCAVVVHHGGAGTSHTALHAGVPSVVVAHIDEQRFWGEELNRFGFAPRVLKRQGLTAKSLAKRIHQARTFPYIRATVQAVTRVMNSEDGIATAIDTLEAVYPEQRF